jgi:hypothetical protein
MPISGSPTQYQTHKGCSVPLGTCLKPMSKRAPDPFPLFKPRGTPANLDAFNIAETADHLIGELERGKGKREGGRFLAYTFLVHMTRNGQVPTEDLLRLVAAALGIRAGRVPFGAAKFLGFPPINPAHYLKFFAAAHADGDAEARGLVISEIELAERVGVDRETISSWRKMKRYRERKEWVHFHHTRAWGFVLSENEISRDLVKLDGSSPRVLATCDLVKDDYILRAGTVLGLIAATGMFAPSPKIGSDGSENARAGSSAPRWRASAIPSN